MSVAADRDSIEVERRGPVTVLTLDRPDSLNALSHGLLRRFDELLDELKYDYAQRVIVLAGAGRAFCAGMDLKGQADGAVWVEDAGPTQATYALQEAVGRLIAQLRDVPQPIVAAVHGVAAGGGLSLASASDRRVAEKGTRFIASFVRLGVSGGDMGSSWFLPRIVGWERAADILYTGREIGADEALEMGLVSEVVEQGAARERAVELAEAMCVTSPFGLRQTKSLLNLSRDGLSLRHHLELENRTQVMATTTADFSEGGRAFAERRDPVFKDR
ncbi:enoyl-CoA hydratase/isomerase family protein [Nocardioides sp. BGMRC 2183]|jgi:enoyl-CoA hydratase|nr:enoyl-CoA hydratase/isomerase family protein [Nocardioides sp. BGMRC 2183]